MWLPSGPSRSTLDRRRCVLITLYYEHRGRAAAISGCQWEVIRVLAMVPKHAEGSSWAGPFGPHHVPVRPRSRTSTVLHRTLSTNLPEAPLGHKFPSTNHLRWPIRQRLDRTTGWQSKQRQASMEAANAGMLHRIFRSQSSTLIESLFFFSHCPNPYKYHCALISHGSQQAQEKSRVSSISRPPSTISPQVPNLHRLLGERH